MLPLVAISMLAVVQVSLLVWDQLRVAHAAREGARVLALTNEPTEAADAALRAANLDPGLASVEIAPDDRPIGTPSRVTVRYRSRVVVPFMGRFAAEFTLEATVWMRVERDPP